MLSQSNQAISPPQKSYFILIGKANLQKKGETDRSSICLFISQTAAMARVEPIPNQKPGDSSGSPGFRSSSTAFPGSQAGSRMGSETAGI